MSVEEVLLLAYLGINIVALLSFLIDKWAARRKYRRISERTLLTLALFGPVGAITGMLAFHHKTRKRKFLLVPVFLSIHLLLFILLVTKLI
jgi:uncharacterized membrane protein YsdA (DUF1294 family)